MTSTKTWIPVDVKVHWFGFLGAKDLANCQRVCRPDCYVIENAKTRRTIASGMMTGGAHCAKSVFVCASHDQIHRHDRCSRRVQCRIQGMHIHPGVAIQHRKACLGSGGKDPFHVIGIVRPQQVFTFGAMRIVMPRNPINA
jgi:hypothetical protein